MFFNSLKRFFFVQWRFQVGLLLSTDDMMYFFWNFFQSCRGRVVGRKKVHIPKLTASGTLSDEYFIALNIKVKIMYDTPAIVNCVSKVLLGGNYNFMFSKISKAQLRHKYLMFMINRKCKKRCNGSKRLRVICFWSKSITAVTKGAVTYKFFFAEIYIYYFRANILW